MNSTSNVSKILIARLKKIAWTLGLHAFMLILIFVFIDILLGGFIFYQYAFLPENQEPGVAQNVLRFDHNAYQDVTAELQSREQNNNFK